jgi:hypothetical protein
MSTKELIRDTIFDNYEDIRTALIRKHNNYYTVKRDNDSIYGSIIDKQFVDSVKSYVIQFVVNTKNGADVQELELYVEEYFTWDNIERIVGQDGWI